MSDDATGKRVAWRIRSRRVPDDNIHRFSTPDRAQYLAGLQKDAVVLLRYVANRADRPLSMPGMAKETGVSGVIFGQGTQAGSDSHIDQLQQMLDQLSRLASPATATSIRLTEAYLGNPSIDGEPPAVVRKQAEKLKLRLKMIRWFTILIFGLTVVALLHATAGRQALEQLSQQQAVLTVLEDRLVLVNDQGGGAPAPEATVSLAASAAVPSFPDCMLPVTGQKLSLAQTCYRWHLVLEEQAFTRTLLAQWNCRSQRAFGQLWPWEVCGSAPPPAGTPSVNSTSIVATNFLAMFNSFLLPMLVGTLGGGVYVLRRFDNKIREMTLSAGEPSHGVIRIALAAIMGSLLGLIWEGGKQVQIGDISFSVTALAFFVGFSLEIVFSVIETMVGSIAGRLSSGPGGMTPMPAPLLLPPPATPGTTEGRTGG